MLEDVVATLRGGREVREGGRGGGHEKQGGERGEGGGKLRGMGCRGEMKERCERRDNRGEEVEAERKEAN